MNVCINIKITVSLLFEANGATGEETVHIIRMIDHFIFLEAQKSVDQRVFYFVWKRQSTIFTTLEFQNV